MKDVDEKSKKIVDLENTNTRLRLMLDQSKEITGKSEDREVRFENNKTK